MAQYYFILAAQAYIEDTSDELSFALKQVELHRQQVSTANSSRDALNSYYAGHLYLLSGDRHMARTCFEEANPFLPAMYMTMKMYDAEGIVCKREECIRAILHHERTGMRGDEGLCSFLQLHRSAASSKPERVVTQLQCYVHALEIQEAITVVHEWIGEYGDEVGVSCEIDCPPPSIAFNEWMQTVR